MILIPGLPLNLDNIRGGVHSAVSNLLKGFANYDIDIRVVSFNREVTQDSIVVVTNRIEVHYSFEGSYNYHSLNYLLAGPSILKRHIKDFNPDILHFQEGSSFMLTRIKGVNGVKTLQTIHGMSFAEAKRKKTIKDKITWYFNGVLQMWLLPKNIIHLSQFSVNLFSKQKIKNQTIIPNAIVPNYFKIPHKTTCNNSLLYVGVIDNNKNLIFLLTALNALVAKNKAFTLNVLGDYLSDVYKKLINSYVKENKLEPYVNFQGWVSQSAVMRYIEESDILVVSSKHESLPMVIAEAMAAGKVVAASAVGGIPEMIRHNIDGFLYNLEHPEELVQILEGLHNNNERVQDVSKLAIAAAQRYNCNNVAEKTIAFYKTCI